MRSSMKTSSPVGTKARRLSSTVPIKRNSVFHGEVSFQAAICSVIFAPFRSVSRQRLLDREWKLHAVDCGS